MAVKKGDGNKHVKFSGQKSTNNTPHKMGKKPFNDERERKPQNDNRFKKPQSDTTEKHSNKPGKAKANVDEDILREQIEAMGGTKGDVSFLRDIDNDDNDDLITATNDTPDSLQKELKSFMSSIGLNSSMYDDDLDEASEEEEEEEKEEEEEEEEKDEEDENEEEDEETNEDNHGNYTSKVEETEQPERPFESTLKRDKSKLIVEPTPHWHNVELAPIKMAGVKHLSDTEIGQKYQYAKELLEQENAMAESHSMLSSSDRKFMSNLLKSGTANDKLSALILLIQESPLHGLKSFDMLIAMTKKKSKKEAEMATKGLKDLFVGSVMPERKLSYFADHPLGSPAVTDKHLLLWVFEDHLKKVYFDYIQQIEALSHDTLYHLRYSMVVCLHDLLAGKPEQEQNLLKLLVNKLGDAENKVSSKASQMLVDLLVQHPGMKIFVVRELEQLLLRPNVSERAQYYTIITANQIIFTGKDTAVASKLIEIYFFFFRKVLHIFESEEKEAKKTSEHEKTDKPARHKKRNKKEKNSPPAIDMEDKHVKMLEAILTGVNRAFHFADIPDDVFEKHMNVLFKITHAGTFNVAIQALSLIATIAQVKPSLSDRFYRTLYESMLDTRLLTSSKHAMYLNLLYRSIRADADMKRTKAFIKRMVQIASQHQPTFICGLFSILSQLMEQHRGLRLMLTSPEEDDDEEHFVDAPEEQDEEEATDVAKEETQEEPEKQNMAQNAEVYDGRKRDPRFSNADKSCLWELIPFKQHYHPAVAKYAQMVFDGELIPQSDLKNHTLIHFLDRFVYRNPKKQTTTKGSSMMQPLSSRRDGGVLFTRGGGVDPKKAVLNSEEFWHQKVDSVPVDEVFFHKYFTQKAARQGPKEKKRKDDDEEDEVWRAMMASMPGAEDLDDSLDEDEHDDEEMRALLLEDSDNDDDDKSEAGSDMEGDGMMDDEEGDFPEMLSSDEEEEEEEEEESMGVKRRANDEDAEDAKPSKKRSKRAQLPTFASYEDYAKLLDNDD